MHDWDLRTNLRGLYVAGDQLFASDCAGHACATGYYAGRKAAAASADLPLSAPDASFVSREMQRMMRPFEVHDGLDWREVNMAAAKAMQNFCGGVRSDALMRQGLDLIRSLRDEALAQVQASNPHEAMRTHEVADILDVCELILCASLMRKCSSEPLFFVRSDSREENREKETGFMTIRMENGDIRGGFVPHGYAGDVTEAYEKRNQDYMQERKGCEA